jgi:amino acid adenylation domain-containing protein
MSDLIKFDKKNVENIYALTPMQEGMFFHYLKDPKSEHYFEQLTLEISGEIDTTLFEKAWNFVIETNEMLRAVFRWEKIENPIQIILKRHQLQPQYFDLSGVESNEKKKQVEEIKEGDRREKFDLREVPFRVTLVKMSQMHYYILISNHHILYDGWSTGIILKEFFRVYEVLAKGSQPPLAPVKPGFKEFIRWHGEQNPEEQKKFWQNYLEGIETPTRLPVKQLKSSLENPEERNYRLHLKKTVKDQLEVFVKEKRLSLAAVFYSAWGLLLQKYCCMEDVVFGTIVSGRSTPIREIENMVGLFINTIPHRAGFEPGETLLDFLFRINNRLAAMRKYENTPLVDIYGCTQRSNQVGEELFDTIVAVENYPLDTYLRELGPRLSIRSHSMDERPHYDLTLVIAAGEGIDINFIYNNRLFEKETVLRLAGHFRTILEGIEENAHNRVHKVDMLSVEEKHQLIKEFNRTETFFPGEKIIHRLFAEQVERTPDNIALVGPLQGKDRPHMTYISYRELNEKVDGLAYTLIEKGVQTDTIVGIMVERSIEMVTGILGILKAGGAYLPIDPEYPQERINFMVKDSGAKILLTGKELTGWLSSSQEPLLNLSEGRNFTNDPLAYVIYTSGSTGKPKGVVVQHGSVVNLLWAMQSRYPSGERDTYLLKTSYLFDVSVTELFGWFLGGGSLAVLEKGSEKDPRRIIRMIELEGVTHINFVPSMFHAFEEELDAEAIVKLCRLKNIFLAGEALLPGLVTRFRQLNAAIALENIYGPTEAAVYASWYSLSNWTGKGPIPIGKSLPNVGLYILDHWSNLQPIGVPGELCISGVGLACGYLNSPELTNSKFQIPNKEKTTLPHSPYSPIYRTGDLARWLPDGNIEFLGRMDFQVKVRGFRIELGEIENQLIGHEGIKEAVVSAIVDKTAGNALCAYLVPCLPGELAIDPIRNFLKQKLPDYMIPGYFVILEQIPLTGSGKVDRKALPEPGVISTQPYAAPTNEIEVDLVSIWADVLGLDRGQIGIDDNFFELGGHSLKATTLVSRIHKKLKFRFPLQQVFEMFTVRTQAAYMAKPGDSLYDSIKPVEEMEYYDLSYAQRRLFVLCQFEEDLAAYNMPRAEAVSGRFDTGAFIKAVQNLAHRHESLRTIFIQVDGTPRQKIVKDFTFNLETIDLRELEQEEKEKQAREIYIKDANRTFDLQHGPLFRFTLIRLQDEEYVLIFNIHHIINDGWSQGIIHNEIINLYNKNPLPPLQLQYRDYTRWHNRCIDTGRFHDPGRYWLEKFKDKPNGIQLPLDHPRRPIQTFNGGRVTRALGKEKTKQLHRISREQDATLFMSLLTLLDIFLYKYSGQNDIIVGAPIAGRRHAELHPLVGFLVNTLVYRSQVTPDHSFKQFLAAVKEEALNCYRNQDYPFDLMVEELELDRVLTQSPIFNVMLAHNNAETRDNSLMMAGAKMSRYVHADDYNMSKFDLIFFMDEIDDQVWLQLEYNSDLFEHQTIERMAANFLTLMERVTREVNAPISFMSCLSEPEYQRVIHEFNTTASPFPPLTVQELLEKQVMRSKDKTALVYNEEHMSYEALNSQINQYAHYLREEHGVSPNDVIGIAMERSIRMIALLLGIIKSGAAYLAVDPTYPRERVLHVLADSQAEVLVTDKIRPEFFADYPGKIIEINAQTDETINTCKQNPVIRNQPADILYVNYTSGSTGTPNGAMLSHGLLSNLIQWQSQKSSIDCSLRCLQFTTINFCVSFQEILGTLTSGGELHLIGETERQDIDYLMDFLSRHRIENLFLPFSYLNFLFTETGRWHESFRHHLKHMITAGEQLKVTPGLEAFLNRNPRVKLDNHYGSTEMHVVTSYTLDASSAAQIPIPPSGKPIGNTRIYILDEQYNPVPVGVWGELFVAGACEFLGYINNTALTGKKLIHHTHLPPEEPKMRLYRTGDLGRWLANGNIEYKGRKDLMVKIRGFRVELGEIETQLLVHRKVKEATVIVGDGGSKDKYLCAYIVAKSQETDKIDPLELREYLANRLPDYMIPSYFLQLDKIPLTPNGKVDKEALPAPGIQEGKDYAPPRDNTEKKLQDIWSGVLGIEKEKIGIRDNFFHLGGHSLKATVLVSRIYKELAVKVPLTEIFITPSIQALAAFVKNAEKQKFFSITPVEKKEYYILSSAQRRLFILQQMDEQGIGYNMPSLWQVEGHLEVEKFETVFQRLSQRHESLRTSFTAVKDEPVQRIEGEVKVKVKVEDGDTEGTRGLAPLSGEPAARGPQPTEALISSFIRPFNLSQAPLLRVGLIKMNEQTHILMVDMHHIVSDGISIGILIKEFIGLYVENRLPRLKLQYKDYSQWHNGRARLDPIKVQENHWLKQFEEEIPVLELPMDFLRPTVQDFAGSTIHFEIHREEADALKSMARQQGVTLFMLLLSLYNIFLGKLSGQEDIVVGIPTAGRRHTDLQGIVGMLVNTLALRNFPVIEKTFAQFLKEVGENTVKAFENQDYQYEDLVEKVDVRRDASRNPLFDTLFTVQNFDMVEIEIPGLKLEPYQYKNKTSKFDLSLIGLETQEKLLFTFEYSTALFKESTIQCFTGYYRKVIQQVLERPQVLLSDVEIISDVEKRQLVFEFNNTKKEYPADKSIHELFEQQVEKGPQHIALVGQFVQVIDVSPVHELLLQITYEELNKKASRLARFLREQGVSRDTVVGVMTEPCLQSMIGILGILKAGGAYLPINPTLPPGRIEYILNDSAIPVLLSYNNAAGETKTPPAKTLIHPGDGEIYSTYIGSNHSHAGPAYEYHPNDLAYVIYTSGSTGRPKGVGVEHSQLVNFVYHMYNRYDRDVDCDDRCLSLTNIMFDVSVWEFFLPLSFGARLILMQEQKRFDVFALPRVIIEEGITLIYLPPGLLKPVYEQLQKQRHGLRLNKMLVGVEPIRDEVLEDYMRLNPGMKIINGYGPTETTICASSYNYPSRQPRGEIVPIGVPLSNNQIVLLAGGDRVVVRGVSGEICISGDGVSRGYLNNPELTAEKYTPHLYFKGKRMYRTGDMARLLPDGNLRFIGRRDKQLKIRGHRIELGEIETALLKHKHIKGAVVISRKDLRGDIYLCAYIVSEIDIEVPGLKNYLAGFIPDYMIPSYILKLEKLPLTANGKIDGKALPEPGIKPGHKYKAPGNHLEKKLVEIWSNILGIESHKIGVNSNFFELGGHSLKAMAMTLNINRDLDVGVPLTEIFKNTTIRKLAQYIKNVGKGQYTAVSPVERREYYELSPPQKRLFLLDKIGNVGLAYNLPMVCIIEGSLDRRHFNKTFQTLINRHESLRTSFHMLGHQPVQRIHDRVEFEIEYYDLVRGSREGNQGHQREELIKTFIRPFDLSRAPLLRVGLVNTGDNKHIFMLDLHHIITDGVSTRIFMKEFTILYKGTPLPPLKIHYKDFSGWQRNRKNKEIQKQQERYWLDKFKDDVPVLNFPTDFPRPTVQSFEGDSLTFRLDRGLTRKLKELTEKTGATLNMALVAVLYILISKYSGQEEVVVAIGIAGRTHADLEHMIGFFVNSLVIRSQPEGDKPFQQFLEEVKKNTLEAYENQDYPFDDLVDRLNLSRDSSRNPLFDILFTQEDFDSQEMEINGLKFTPYEFTNKIAHVDLVLYAFDELETVKLVLEYSTALFKPSTAENITQRYIEILRQVAANKDIKLKDIKISLKLKDAALNEHHEDYADFDF